MTTKKPKGYVLRGHDSNPSSIHVVSLGPCVLKVWHSRQGYVAPTSWLLGLGKDQIVLCHASDTW